MTLEELEELYRTKHMDRGGYRVYEQIALSPLKYDQKITEFTSTYRYSRGTAIKHYKYYRQGKGELNGMSASTHDHR